MLYNHVDATPRIAGGQLEDGRSRRVSDMLREGFDGFSRSQKAVARYIIDHLEEVGYLSAEELGQKGNTSSSTVVRFAQSLGFAGYPELQKAARDEYRLGATARPVVHDDQLGFSIEEDLLTRSLKTDVLSLEETISKNTVDRFNRSVKMLAGARQVLAVGLHEAAVVAEHTAYVLELLGTQPDG
jgi:DNA-binding MurR/RpiR family transcriptional regulator